VWGLVTEPGWWIGDGESEQKRSRAGRFDVVEGRYGRFPVSVETVEPQRYVAYRWASTFPGEDPGEGNSSLVEFWLSERDGGTLLRVAESGFTSLTLSGEERERSVNGNIDGWRQQCDIIKSRAERVRV
jgi:uncharacterized protein YndB with AHSA1/START domain